MIGQNENLNLLGCSLWGYDSWCDKLAVGSGLGLSVIGDFPSNFGWGAVPAFKLLEKPVSLAVLTVKFISILCSASLML